MNAKDIKIGDRVIASCDGKVENQQPDREMRRGEIGIVIDLIPSSNVVILRAESDGKRLARDIIFLSLVKQEVINNYQIY